MFQLSTLCGGRQVPRFGGAGGQSTWRAPTMLYARGSRAERSMRLIEGSSNLDGSNLLRRDGIVAFAASSC